MTQTLEQIFADVWVNLAAENDAAALRLVEKAIALHPEQPQFYKLAGDAFLMLGDASRALAFYATAFRKQPENAESFARVLHVTLLLSNPDLEKQLEENISTYTPGADLYAALANSYVGVGRYAKAIEWFDAAAKLDAAPKYKIESALLRGDDATVPALLDTQGRTLWDEANETFAAPAPTLTCLVTTNLTKKLVVNKAKAPPKLDLIADTLASWRAAMKPESTRVIINFDAPKTPDADTEAYAGALRDYCTQYGYELVIKNAAGLKQSVIDALATTDTGFFTQLEHDFLFNSCPPQADIMAEITAHPFMHVVQFNRRPNIPVRWDSSLWPEPRSAMPLLKTPRYSNNPFIGRTAKIKTRFQAVFTNPNKFDGTNSGAGGLEEIVKNHIATLVTRYGFGFAHRWSGYYLYGKALDAPRLTHTGI